MDGSKNLSRGTNGEEQENEYARNSARGYLKLQERLKKNNITPSRTEMSHLAANDIRFIWSFVVFNMLLRANVHISHVKCLSKISMLRRVKQTTAWTCARFKVKLMSFYGELILLGHPLKCHYTGILTFFPLAENDFQLCYNVLNRLMAFFVGHHKFLNVNTRSITLWTIYFVGVFLKSTHVFSLWVLSVYVGLPILVGLIGFQKEFTNYICERSTNR